MRAIIIPLAALRAVGMLARVVYARGPMATRSNVEATKKFQGEINKKGLYIWKGQLHQVFYQIGLNEPKLRIKLQSLNQLQETEWRLYSCIHKLLHPHLTISTREIENNYKGLTLPNTRIAQMTFVDEDVMANSSGAPRKV